MAENDLASKALQTHQIQKSQKSQQSEQSQGKKPNSSMSERSGFLRGRLRIDKNAVSIPVDSLLFPIIAFAGIVGANGL
jgi:hypothetical protein